MRRHAHEGRASWLVRRSPRLSRRGSGLSVLAPKILLDLCGEGEGGFCAGQGVVEGGFEIGDHEWAPEEGLAWGTRFNEKSLGL